ncbi:MAG: glycerol-3-phosphate transporter, partial [Hydrogenophaga sp.]|nr:glycerol-3-phosphate transporter [Hydrogenophaga sp.]
MIERRPGLTFLAHFVLTVGVAIVAFPVYLTLVASTQSSEQIATSVPMSLLPGSHMVETYRIALFGGETAAGSTLPA